MGFRPGFLRPGDEAARIQPHVPGRHLRAFRPHRRQLQRHARHGAGHVQKAGKIARRFGKNDRVDDQDGNPQGRIRGDSDRFHSPSQGI